MALNCGEAEQFMDIVHNIKPGDIRARIKDQGIDLFNTDGLPAIVAAAHAGNAEVAGELLYLGVDPNARDREGHTALLRASENGNVEMIALLIEAGAKVNYPGSYGMTPLMMACKKGQREAVQNLVDLGAALEAEEDLGHTPLYFAAVNGHAEIVDDLLAQGVDVFHEVCPDEHPKEGPDSQKQSISDIAHAHGKHEVAHAIEYKQNQLIEQGVGQSNGPDGPDIDNIAAGHGIQGPGLK
jgi:ankyrin repeat protein